MRNSLIMPLVGMVLSGLILAPKASAQEEPKATFSERKTYSSEASERSYSDEQSEEGFFYWRLPGLSEPSMICRNDDWNNDLEFKWCLKQAMGDLDNTREVAKLND